MGGGSKGRKGENPRWYPGWLESLHQHLCINGLRLLFIPVSSNLSNIFWRANSPWVSHISVHFRSTDCICSGLSFQKYLYSKSPWKKKKKVPLQKQRRGLFAIWFNNVSYFPLLKTLGSLNSQTPSYNATCGAHRSCVNAAPWILLLLWVVKVLSLT